MKNNLITDTTALAMYVAGAYLHPGDFAVDATCGRGNDTVALAKAVGPAGRVLALDIQEEAVAATEERLREEGLSNVTVVRDSFVNVQARWRGTMGGALPQAIVFNLGYLPGGDKTVTTTAETTLAGLAAALEILAAGGIIAIVMYDGHPAGAAEKQAVLGWAEGLDAAKYHAGYLAFPNQTHYPPEILWITKKA